MESGNNSNRTKNGHKILTVYVYYVGCIALIIGCDSGCIGCLCRRITIDGIVRLAATGLGGIVGTWTWSSFKGRLRG